MHRRRRRRVAENLCARTCSWSLLVLEAGDIARHRLDLFVAVALRLPTHDGGKAVIVSELAQFSRDGTRAQIGEAWNAAGAPPVRAVTGEAVLCEVTCRVRRENFCDA